MIRADHAFNSLPQGPAPTGRTSVQTGTLRGEHAIVMNESSPLGNAAEEISMFNSSNAEKKKLDERKVGPGQQAHRLLMEQIKEYLDQSRAFENPTKLKELIGKMLQPSGQNPRSLARQHSDDPATQYVLLQYALSEGEQNGVAVQVREHLQEILEDMEAEHGPRINAGLNSMPAAARWGTSAGEIATFQQAYADVVLGDSVLSRTLTLVLERLAGASGERFELSLKELIFTLGRELSASRPTTSDTRRIQALIEDLYQLEVCATVLEGCRELGIQVKDALKYDPVEIMKELVTVTGEKWVTEGRFIQLANRLEAHDTPLRITILTKVKSLLTLMPIKVFSDAEARQAVLQAAQDALDHAIDLEDEESP